MAREVVNICHELDKPLSTYPDFQARRSRVLKQRTGLMGQLRRNACHAEGTASYRLYIRNTGFDQFGYLKPLFGDTCRRPYAGFPQDMLGIDLENSTFGSLEPGGSKNPETRILMLSILVLKNLLITSQLFRLDEEGKQKVLIEALQLTKWSGEYQNMYGEPFYLADNIAGVCSTLEELEYYLRRFSSS